MKALYSLSLGLLGAALSLSVSRSASAQEAAEEGCWVWVYDGANFGSELPDADPLDPRYGAPRDVVIKGPTQIRELDAEATVALLKGDWNDDIESLIVGPKARACFYEEQDYDSERLCLEPGQRVADLDTYDLDDDIESLTIECVP